MLEVADVANLSKGERILYDEALKRYRDYKNTIDYAEEKGLAEGKAEALRSTAKSMKEKNLPIAMKAELTGLTENEIQTL